MKKTGIIITIILAITVIAMATGLTFSWFVSEEKMNSTIIHQANAPIANVEVADIAQSGSLAPAIPYVDSDGVPSYVNDPQGFETYVSTYGLLQEDGLNIDTAAQTVEVIGKFKYEGKDDNGEDIGTRTLVIEVNAENHETLDQIDNSNFSFNFEADDDNDDQTPACIIKTNADRTSCTKNNVTYLDVFLIEVTPAALDTDWYWFTLTIYFSEIDDEMDTTLNGMAIDFTINVIAA